jgi:hypothetical protein
MRLGRDTGSVVNYVMAGGHHVVVGVGDAATLLHWTDRTAGTVIDVKVSKSGKTVTVRVQEDTAVRVDDNGMSECQSYTYVPNTHGAVHTFVNRGRGWKGVAFGVRRSYHDYSF